MSDELDLEAEQQKIKEKLKELDRTLNKGVPLSHASEKLVQEVIDYVLDARIKKFSRPAKRKHLKSVKNLFTFRLEVYEEARNSFIPEASDWTDEQVAEKDEEWSRYFFSRLDELASRHLKNKTHLWLKNNWE
jgi:hypothetical protein